MATTQEQNQPNYENPHLTLSNKERLAALKQANEVVKKPNPTQAEKQNYVDSIIAVQHMIADTPADPQKVGVFSELFAVHIQLLAQKNILLPLDLEVVKPEEKNFGTYVSAIAEMVTELTELKESESQPSKEQTKKYTTILISFQRFLAEQYTTNITPEDKAIIEASIQLFAQSISGLAVFGIKLPTQRLEFSANNQTIQENTAKTSETGQQKESILKELSQRVADLRTKFAAEYPVWSKAVRETLARGIASYEDHQARKRAEKQLKERQKREIAAEKYREKVRAEETRQQAILDNLRVVPPGYEVQLLNTKGKVTETHTVLKNGGKSEFLEVTTYNHRTRKTSENRVFYYQHYLDIHTAADVRFGKREPVIQQPLPQKAEVPVQRAAAKVQEATTTQETKSQRPGLFAGIKKAAAETVASYRQSYADRQATKARQKAEKNKPKEKETLNWDLLQPGVATLQNLDTEEVWETNQATGQREARTVAKANQDAVGYFAKADYRNPNQLAYRYVVADGSGGSTEIQDSQKVFKAMDKFIKEAVNTDRSLRESTFAAANLLYDLIRTGKRPDLAGYGTFVAAEVFADKIDICWKGDPAALLWKSGKPFQHERSAYHSEELSHLKIRGGKSQFQLQNFMENRANWLFSIDPDSKDPVRETISLDTGKLANLILDSIGDRTHREVTKIGQFEISKQEVIQSGAEFLILATDGAQPNTMIAMRPDNPYNQAVNGIMEELKANKITKTDAAQKIALASRNINQDSDDISVMIVDLRQWAQS